MRNKKSHRPLGASPGSGSKSKSLIREASTDDPAVELVAIVGAGVFQETCSGGPPALSYHWTLTHVVSDFMRGAQLDFDRARQREPLAAYKDAADRCAFARRLPGRARLKTDVLLDAIVGSPSARRISTRDIFP